MVQDRSFGRTGTEHMKVIIPSAEQNGVLARLMQKRLGGGLSECQCMAVMDGERLVGVVSFFNFRWPSIEVGFYCDDYRWALNRERILEVFAYPFSQLQCQRVTALIDKKNYRARKMVQRLGFKEEGKLRKASDRGDMFIYGLLPEELRFTNGQQPQPAASARSA